MAISLYFQALTPLCLYMLNLHIFKHLCAFIAKWTFYGNLQICAEAGFGRSIYERLQLLVPEKQSLTHQYVLHPLMLKIMNIYFYNGRLKCGANDILLESNKEFKSKLLRMFLLWKSHTEEKAISLLLHCPSSCSS